MSDIRFWRHQDDETHALGSLIVLWGKGRKYISQNSGSIRNIVGRRFPGLRRLKTILFKNTTPLKCAAVTEFSPLESFIIRPLLCCGCLCAGKLRGINGL